MNDQVQRQIWIKEEESGASLIEREIIIPNKVIEQVIVKRLSKRLEDLERQVNILKEKKEIIVTNSEAKEILIKSINSFKYAGIKEIDIIDLHNETHLPICQINEVMSELEKEEMVKEFG